MNSLLYIWILVVYYPSAIPPAYYPLQFKNLLLFIVYLDVYPFDEYAYNNIAACYYMLQLSKMHPHIVAEKFAPSVYIILTIAKVASPEIILAYLNIQFYAENSVLALFVVNKTLDLYKLAY